MKDMEKVHLRPNTDPKAGFTINKYLTKNKRPSAKAMQNHLILNFTKLQIMVYNIQDLEESRFWNRST
jgi:hypothetical protein